jgi:neurotransmitter:Na+ symporter, NSS family
MLNKRETWTSKIGVILAVAGSAIGLGNFLRFPVKAATYGGGAFLIPYFVALIFLGIPLAWIEWTLGRYGGGYGHGSAPGILHAAVKKPWAKYMGSLGVLGPLLIFFYYTYIESWLLGFGWYALTGDLMQAVNTNMVSTFFGDYISLKIFLFANIPASFFFFVLTFAANFIIIYMGIRSGIEKINKIALPVIFLLGFILLVRVITLPRIEEGFGFMWNPDFSKLTSPRVWLEASGQIFFTLSVGIGAVLTYASFVKKNQDIALSSLSSCAANEFAEVILGGTIVIPLAVVIYGATNIEEIAKMGTFGLGFNTMPIIFGHLPFSALLQFSWFFLLFLAGITSSISLLQPPVSFFEDELGLTKRTSVMVTALVCFFMGLCAIFGLKYGVVDELDFWGGTFSLVLFGTIEAVLFSWVFGVDKGWKELMHGAEIRVPQIFIFIFKYITPTYLIAILVGWFVTEGWSFITLSYISPEESVTVFGHTVSKIIFIATFRILLLLMLAILNLIIFIAWRQKETVGYYRQ